MQDTEARRLATLKSLGILDTPPEILFDQLTQLGARFLNLPTCLISLLDEDRQWFKSCVGIDVRSTSRDISFCDHAIQGRGVMIIPDATRDPRFRNNPLVTDGVKIRFYAGAPIHYDGSNIGTFCVIGYKPNPEFGDRESAILTHLATITAEIMRRDFDHKAHDILL